MNRHFIRQLVFFKTNCAFLEIDFYCQCVSSRKFQSLKSDNLYHFWLGVEVRLMMTPRVGWLMCCSNVVDSPSSFPHTITVSIVKRFNNVFYSYSKPTSFVTRLFFQSNSETIVELWKRFIKKNNWVRPNSFCSSGLKLICTNGNAWIF